MNTLWLILTILSATFAFAFLAAAVIPLALAAENADHESNGRVLLGLQLDKLLTFVGCIPVFWFLLNLDATPEQSVAVRQAWSENRSLRVMFYLGCGLVLAAIFGFRTVSLT